MSEEKSHMASCRCGQLKAMCAGDPFRISVCHCLACQKRTGSAMAAQVRFAVEQVALTGKTKSWTRTGDSGDSITYDFCPDCGSTVHFIAAGFSDYAAIPLGAFDDPHAFAPGFSVYEERQHKWLAILGDDVEHMD